MRAPVVVTSTSKLLVISMLNDRCSLKCSDDCSALFVDPPDNTFVSTIDLCMKDNEGNEISAVSFSMGCTSGQQRIRTDGLFSIVFDAGESIALVPEWLSDDYATLRQEQWGRFEMAVNIHLLDAVPDSFVSRTAPVPIHSGALRVGDSTLSISKEILAVTSPFFNALFYGSFSVVQNDIFEMKEVDEDDFLWFINSILCRKWTFESVELALVALTYADRFEMLYLHKCTLPYLLKNNLTDESIKDTLLLCDRFKENEELIMWVLRQCKDIQTRADLVFECAPEMKKCSILAAHKALKEVQYRPQFITDALANPQIAPICLRFYDANGVVEGETYFTAELDQDQEFLYDLLRNRIPEEYTEIKTEEMSAPVVVTSTKKLLRISLLNDRCSLKCSDDCSALFLDPPDNAFVSTIDLCIKDNDGNEISAVSFSMGCTSGQQRIRTDGLFSIVFDAGESIVVIPELLSDHYSTESLVDKCGRFELAVNIHLLDSVPDSFVSRTTPVPIHCDALKVGNSAVLISKEILAVTSPFFMALFYGSFSEVQKNIFEIKEVDEDDFIWFINSFLSGKWTFASVDQALVALTYADRFEMLYLHKHALPYLLSNSLSQDAIKDMLLLCDRFKQNEALIEWVLRQCEDVQAMTDLVFECAPEMQRWSILAALKVLKELQNSRASAVKDVFNSLVAPICLRFYDENDIIERELRVTVKLDGDREFNLNVLWPMIPEKYTVVMTEGFTKRRNERQWVKVCSPKIVYVHAYRSEEDE